MLFTPKCMDLITFISSNFPTVLVNYPSVYSRRDASPPLSHLLHFPSLSHTPRSHLPPVPCPFPSHVPHAPMPLAYYNALLFDVRTTKMEIVNGIVLHFGLPLCYFLISKVPPSRSAQRMRCGVKRRTHHTHTHTEGRERGSEKKNYN